MKTPKYGIGTTYNTRGKFPKLCTVIDIYTTRNLAGEVVAINYVSSHVFSGQVILDSSVCETSIAMGLVEAV